MYNGGDVRVSATLLGDGARAVVGIIGRREETTDRVVYVHSAVVAQKQLLRKRSTAESGSRWRRGLKRCLRKSRKRWGRGISKLDTV